MKSQFVFPFVVVALVSCTTKPNFPKSDTLWHIISTKCIPQAGTKENRCDEVDISQGQDRGHVVFKDQRGELQYLLMPTKKITGMESAELLDSNSPNYFDLAWKARSYMEKKHGAAIPLNAVSLAINSQFGRSQNQLHVHISCTVPAVQKKIQTWAQKPATGWQLLPGGIDGHAYYAKQISEKELETIPAFLQLANGLPEAKENMGEFGLGMVAVNRGKTSLLVLLTSRRDLQGGNRGSVEEIQDHDCPQLKAPLTKPQN